jgi:hypothetical protein
MRVILQTLSKTQRMSSRLRYVNCGPGHIQCIYCSAYWDLNVHLNVSALLLEISRQFNERYTAIMVPNTTHVLRFTLRELWSRDIQCNNSSAYSGCNIQVKVSALMLQIYRQFNARYTANLVTNTAHIVQFTLYELWSRTYTKYLQLRIFMLQYSAVGICAAIVDITTIQCALYCKFGAKYRAHQPVYAMWTVVPATCHVIVAPNIQASIFI